MIEDDTYRTSTQYRLWSFTREQLAERRRQTNQLAADKVRAQFRRSRQSHLIHGQNGTSAPVDETANLDEIEQAILTSEDELKLVNWGVRKVQDIAEVLGGRKYRVPTNVVTTATQLLRRFFLTASPMTYHPRPLLSTFLHLAAKAEHFHITVSDIVSALQPDVDPSITEESVKAPEFLILQGLTFALDIRHPMRGLNGGMVEMRRMLKEGKLNVGGGEARVLEAAGEVKELLKKECQGCDAYFLFTPSQIWLGGLYSIDEELAEAFLTAKFEEMGQQDVIDEEFQAKVLETVKQCSEEISRYEDPDDKVYRKGLNRINKKLTVCADPDKVDIVAVMRAKKAEKREGTDSEREEKAKKRKLEKERAERDGDVFGGELRDVKMQRS